MVDYEALRDTVQHFQVHIFRKSPDVPLPARSTDQAVGLDLIAHIEAPLVLEPFEPTLVPTGIYLGMQPGWEAQVRPRSRLNARGVLVGFGTVDPDYRGEIQVTLVNVTKRDYEILPNDRIAQLVFSHVFRPTWVEVENVAQLGETARGGGGFGSTGR